MAHAGPGLDGCSCDARYYSPVIYRTVATEGEPCPYVAETEYRLSLPGLHGKQRLRIQSIERQRLALVTWNEVRNEVGHYRSRGAWQVAWVKRHDKAWCARHPSASDDELERRFRLRWARHDCWVLTFTLLEPPQRYLANQRKVRASYTHRPDREHAIDPLPVIDPDPEYVKQARAEGVYMRAQHKANADAMDAARRADRGRLQRQRYAV